MQEKIRENTKEIKDRNRIVMRGLLNRKSSEYFGTRFVIRSEHISRGRDGERKINAAYVPFVDERKNAETVMNGFSTGARVEVAGHFETRVSHKNDGAEHRPYTEFVVDAVSPCMEDPLTKKPMPDENSYEVEGTVVSSSQFNTSYGNGCVLSIKTGDETVSISCHNMHAAAASRLQAGDRVNVVGMIQTKKKDNRIFYTEVCSRLRVLERAGARVTDGKVNNHAGNPVRRQLADGTVRVSVPVQNVKTEMV